MELMDCFNPSIMWRKVILVWLVIRKWISRVNRTQIYSNGVHIRLFSVYVNAVLSVAL